MRFVRYIIYLLIFCSTSFYVSSQETYNHCNSALELCPNNTFHVNNIGANTTVCPNCEDDFNFCFIPNNSIWMTFTTNAIGGDVQVDFSNLNFVISPGQDTELQATIIEAIVPCDASTYSLVGSCVSNAGANFSLLAVGLTPSTQYYVVVGGDQSGPGITTAAECSFDLTISGPGIDRSIPTISISPTDTTTCMGEVATFTADTTNCPNNTSFRWFVDGTLVATTTDPIFQTTELLNGNSVTVETDCYTQCPMLISATTNPISVTSFPVDAGPNQTISLGQSVILGGYTTVSTYNWSPTFLLNNSTQLNPIANPTETTTFTLTATDGTCTLSDQITITVTNDLSIPNTFSPNNDGQNDTWEIKGIEAHPNAFLVVYNRWGTEVFSSIGYDNNKSWNGTSNSGKNLTEGVYYYVLELRDSEERTYKGSITIIR